MIRRKQVLSSLSNPFVSLRIHQVSLLALHGVAFVPSTSPLRLFADHFGSLRLPLGPIWGSWGIFLLLFGLSGFPFWLSLGLLGPFSAPSALLGGPFRLVLAPLGLLRGPLGLHLASWPPIFPMFGVVWLLLCTLRDRFAWYFC